MWVEQRPDRNDTVKVTFSDFKNLGTKIGVVLPQDCNGRVPVQFGDCVRFLDWETSFEVWVK